jgi:exopolyphosphatase/guanosine-5'-triphosphate,3'-diphosphate pyrophosphatase
VTQLEIHIRGDDLVVVTDSGTDSSARRCLPAGTARLLAEALLGDPPLPEELTNAIGWVVDHLDDLVLERPDLLGSATTVSGVGAVAIAAVEVGGDPPLPFLLTRHAAEDVFRTVVTEPSSDRRLNPGLAADLVHEVVAAACVVVGLMRRLHLDDLMICDRADQTAPIIESDRPAP